MRRPQNDRHAVYDQRRFAATVGQEAGSGPNFSHPRALQKETDTASTAENSRAPVLLG